MAAAPSRSSRAKAHHLALCQMPGHFRQLDESLDSSIRSTDASVPPECLAHSPSLSQLLLPRERDKRLEPDLLGLPLALRSLVGVFGPDTGLFGVHEFSGTHRALRSSRDLETRIPPGIHRTPGGFTVPRGPPGPLRPTNPLRIHRILRNPLELSSSTGLRCCRRPGKLSFRVRLKIPSLLDKLCR